MRRKATSELYRLRVLPTRNSTIGKLGDGQGGGAVVLPREAASDVPHK